MDAKYENEVSNLKIKKIIAEFLLKHFSNFLKRIFYNYYLRDTSLASIELPLGIALLIFGVAFGGIHWVISAKEATPASAGTVMLSGLTILAGLQLILAFIGHDIASVPRRPFHLLRSTSLKKNKGYKN